MVSMGGCDACDRVVPASTLATLMEGGAEGSFCLRCRCEEDWQTMEEEDAMDGQVTHCWDGEDDWDDPEYWAGLVEEAEAAKAQWAEGAPRSYWWEL